MAINSVWHWITFAWEMMRFQLICPGKYSWRQRLPFITGGSRGRGHLPRQIFLATEAPVITGGSRGKGYKGGGVICPGKYSWRQRLPSLVNPWGGRGLRGGGVSPGKYSWRQRLPSLVDPEGGKGLRGVICPGKYSWRQRLPSSLTDPGGRGYERGVICSGKYS